MLLFELDAVRMANLRLLARDLLACHGHYLFVAAAGERSGRASLPRQWWMREKPAHKVVCDADLIVVGQLHQAR